MRTLLLSLVFATGLTGPAIAQDTPPSTPIDPVVGILEAFRTHTIVALGEGAHGNEQGAAFRVALIRDPGFIQLVDDIVVESGNSKYQDLMDRFVRGEDVPREVLRQVWQNTTQPHTLWDVPIYEAFFRAVREVNARAPKGRQLRVLLGDPPIDWGAIRNADDFRKWINESGDRDRFPASVIQREIVEKNRRALVIYGDMHLNRKAVRPKPGAEGSNNIVDVVERAGAKVFAIHTATTRVDLQNLQPGIAAWPRPSLAVLRGTALGATDFTAFYPAPNLKGPDGAPLFPRRIEEQFDAILYLAPRGEITQSRMSPALCADPVYMKMRTERILLLGMKLDIDRLNQQCPQGAGQ
jgi:hypothetical protein